MNKIFSIVSLILIGPNVKIAIAILNCILARQLCFEDPSCSAILEIIPRVCGPVPVACSTVTVTKCQAALRTLQAFPFFRPTCLCKEPGVDPDCNYFRDFLFDHPCGFVLKKVEKDPYPVDALPTCNHALSVCQQERKCIKLFEDFKLHCKVRENKCRMEDKEACHEAWTNLRLSPMFGCICPNNHMKRRCDKIFNVVNHNPCVDVLLPTAHDIASGTSTNSVNSNYFPTSDYIGEIRPASRYPYTFPYFLYPSSRKIPIALASHRPDIDAHNYNRTLHVPHHRTNYNYSYNNNNNNNDNNYDDLDENENVKHFNRILHTFQHNDNFSSVSHKPMANLTNGLMHLQRQLQKQIYDVVRAMGLDDNYHHRILDENAAMIETPLVGPLNSHIRQHFKTALYPYNISMASGGAGNSYNIEDEHGNGNGISSYEKNSDDIETDESHPIHFQSTCHLALDTCRDETSCSTSLQTVLHHCDIDRCNKPACMESLQAFYRDNLHEDLSLDAALCLCRKTSSRHDSCMLAKEKLHPLCAQRPPDGSSTVATTNGAYNMLPACHTLADLCKEDPDCRSRLEFFEQSCAVDSVTKKCAGKMSNCRIALLGIMGTPLRSLCACQGSDLQQLYECLGWQRLLWLNPCVVEAQKDFHLKRLAELGLLITTSTTTTTTQRTTTTTTSTSSTTTTTTPAPIRITFRERLQTSVPQTPPPEIIYHRPASNEDFDTNYIEGEEVVDENFIDDNKDEEFYGITTEMLGMEVATLAPMTTTIETTTIPTRYCVVQRPHTPEQFIPEGQSKRLYIMDDAECSELCSCSAESLALSCHALCVPLVPCRTSLAFYSHTSPAYQAFRGRCLCYSGRFICMRPPPGDYKLPGGVFLLLGYSSTDEALLRPHTNLGVQDAVRALQLYIVQHINNQTQCTLSLFNITDENIILSVRLPYDQKLTTLDMLKREKQFCTSILETVSHQINTEYDELTAHRLLSIFKMAEVQVIWPDLNGAGSAKNVNLLLLIIATFICCTMELSHQMLSSTRT
ncbi:uncharacterized protein [Chironomus tepperi]|uniref:uncharacterized protein isoform X3 n=1 Tax=Chironomus tepperi TaxID=113505 RepID=UPI00391F53C3